MSTPTTFKVRAKWGSFGFHMFQHRDWCRESESVKHGESHRKMVDLTTINGDLLGIPWWCNAGSPPTLKADAADAGKLKVRWDQRKTPTYSKPLLDENWCIPWIIQFLFGISISLGVLKRDTLEGSFRFLQSFCLVHCSSKPYFNKACQCLRPPHRSPL